MSKVSAAGSLYAARPALGISTPSTSTSNSTSSSNSSAKGKPRPRSRTPSRSPSATLAYPEPSDVLVLLPDELPVLTSPSPTLPRSPNRSSFDSSGAWGTASTSSGSSNRGDGSGQDGSDADAEAGPDPDFSLEAELASALSDDDTFFSVQQLANSKSRSPSITTVTAAWPPRDTANGNAKHSLSSSSSSSRGAGDETASASASASTTSTATSSLADSADQESLPSTSATTFDLDSPIAHSFQPHILPAPPSHLPGKDAASLVPQVRMAPPPQFLVQSADDDHEQSFSPSPFPSPPRTIPSLPPRVDISDFGIYSAAPSPTPSPVSTPPSNTRPLPRLGISHGAGAMLNIPDHLPPLNLPQTPLSLPADLPEITLTSPSAIADLAPLSLLSSAPSALLLPPQHTAPNFGRRHTDPGTTTTTTTTKLAGIGTGSSGDGGAGSGSGGGDGLLPAPTEFGGAQEADSTQRRLPSVPTFLSLGGAEEAAELERRLRLLASSADEPGAGESQDGAGQDGDGDGDLEKRLRKMQGCVSCAEPASVICQGQTCAPSKAASTDGEPTPTPFCSDCWADKHARMNGDDLRAHRTEDV